MENVVGDVVVAAGSIAYSGPFTPAFRQQLQLEWIALLKTASVPHTPGTNLIDTLQVLYLAVLFAGACHQMYATRLAHVMQLLSAAGMLHQIRSHGSIYQTCALWLTWFTRLQNFWTCSLESVTYMP